MKSKLNKIRGLILLLLLMLLSANSKFLVSVASESEKSINTENIVATSDAVLEKYINYENETAKGLLVQYGVNAGIEYKNNENYVPLTATGLLFNAPKIEEEYPTSVNIIAKSTLLTNGSNKGKDYKFVYKQETGEIAIVTSNNKNEEGKIYEGYKQNAKDSFSIILNYGENAYNSENKERNLEVSGKVVEALNTTQKTKIQNEFENKQTVKENVSKLVSTKVENTKVYNGYIKSNAVNGTDYETTYKENVKINISKENLGTQKIDLTQKFVNKENVETESENIVFKSSKLEKQNIIDILGEEGSLKILDDQENVLADINKDTQNNEDGTIKIDYPEGTNKITLELSNATKTGNITIQNEKAITAQEKNFELVKIQETYNQDEITNIEIQDSKTEVIIEPSKTTWTNEKQNEVEFKISLHNNSNKYNLFKNPVIAIQLPEETEKVLFNEKTTLTNAYGLKIKNTEYNQEKRIIKVELEGEQTKYLSPALEDGTIIKIPAIIILSNNIESKEFNLKSAYQNENKYTGQTETEVINNKIILENFNQSLTQNDTMQTMTRRLTSVGPTRSVEGTQGVSISVNPVIGDVTRDTVYEGEFIKYEITATNTTEEDIDNVKIVATLPDGVTYGELVREDNRPNVESYYDFEKQIQPIELGTIKAGKNATTYFEVKVNDLAEGETQKQITTNIKAFVGESLSNEKEITHQAENAEYKAVLSSNIYKTDEFKYCLKITGDANVEVPVKIKIPYCLDFCSLSKNFGMAQEPIDFGTVSENNEITVNLKPDNYAIYTRVNNNNINKNNNSSTEEIYAYATIDNKYKSNENRIMLEYEAVSVSIDSSNKSGQVKYGEDIDYELKITNIGKKNYNNNNLDYISVSVSDYLPKEVDAISMTYNYYNINRDENNNAVSYENLIKNDVELKKNITYDDGNIATHVKLDLDIPYQQTVTIQIHTKADLVTTETLIENYFSVTEDNFKWQIDDEVITYNSSIEPKKSKTISHTIMPLEKNTGKTDEQDSPSEPDTPEQPDQPDQPDDPDQPDTPDQPEVNKYNLSGYVWNDKNEDGEKQSNEQLLSGIQTYLLNTKGEVVKEIKTDNNGKYSFADIDNGEYNIVFKYNTNQYRITNSKVTKQDVAINGEKTTVGVTEQLKLNKNIENINLGLVENKKFDFKVENYISKITVKTKNGTTETPYSKANLAKAEIKAKEIEGAVVTVEYKIIVTNNGELPGKVGKVIDYLPEGLNFSAESVSWTKNTDGSLLNTSLSNQTIEAGKSAELTLLATRTMTENSTGTLTNNVKIDDLSNELGMEEMNLQNNTAKSEVILSISTGKLLFIGLLLIIIIAILVFLNTKFNIFKSSTLRAFSVFLVLGIIIIGFGNTPSNAEVTEMKRQYKYFALWNSSGGRWRRRDLDENVQRLDKMQEVWFFDSTEPWYLDINGSVNINMSNKDMHYIPDGNERTVDEGAYTFFKDDEPDLKYNGDWNAVKSFIGREFDYYTNYVQEWQIRADTNDWFFIKGDWGQFCETSGTSRYSRIIDAYAGLCEDPGKAWGNGGYYYDQNYGNYGDSHILPNSGDKFAYYNGQKVNRTDAQKYVWEPTGDARHDFASGYETKYETPIPDFKIVDNNSNNTVKLKEKNGYYILGPFNIKSYCDGTTYTKNEYEYRISGSKNSPNSYITTARYPDYLIPCNLNGTEITKRKGNTGTFYLKILKSNLENDIGNINYIEIVSRIKYDYQLRIVGAGNKLWHVDGWTFDSWQKVSSGYEIINIDINKPNQEVADSIKYTNFQGALTIHKQDEIGTDENGNNLSMEGIYFVVNRRGYGWVEKDNNGNISYNPTWNESKAVKLRTNSDGTTPTLVGLEPLAHYLAEEGNSNGNGVYMIYEIIAPLSGGNSAYRLPERLRDYYKATYPNGLYGCPYSLKAIENGNVIVSGGHYTNDKINLKDSNPDNDGNHIWIESGEFWYSNSTNTRDYVSLQIDKCDQFLGKLGTQANKNNMKGIKFKVFQSGKGWIDKVNRNDEHSDIKYVKFEDAYELVTDANGTTEILRRLPNGGEYLIVETYIPDGTNGTDDLTPYYTLQTAYKDDPSQSSPGVYEIFRNYIAKSSYSRAGENAWGNIKIKAICHKPSDTTSNTILVACQAIKASSSNNGKYVWKARNLRDFITLQIYKQNERTESGKTVNDPLNDVKFAILEETSSSTESNRQGSWITANKDGKYNKTKIASYNYPSQSAANDVLLRSEGKTYSGVFVTGEQPKTYKANGYTRVILNIPLKPGQKYSIFEIDANTYNYLYNEGTFKFKGNNVQGRCIRSFIVKNASTITETYDPQREDQKTVRDDIDIPINDKEGRFLDRYDANGRKIFNVYVVKYTNKQDYGALQIRKVDQLTQTPLKGVKIKIRCMSNQGMGWLKVEKNTDGKYVVTDLHATYDEATALETDAEGYTPTVWKIPIWHSTNVKMPYWAYETFIPTKYRNNFALNSDFLEMSPTNTDADLKKFDTIAVYDASTAGINSINNSEGLNLKWSDCAKLLGQVEVEENIDKNDITKPVITNFKGENEQAFVDISGYVWQEQVEIIKGVPQERDNLKNVGAGQYDDKYLNNITVRLMKKIKDCNGQIHTIKMAETKSGSVGNGKYRFVKVKIKDLENYYIEFDYCGITYETVVPGYTAEDTSIKLNNNNTRTKVQRANSKTSKATEITSDRNALNNSFGELTGEGQKINYKGKEIKLHYIKQESGEVCLENTYKPYLKTQNEQTISVDTTRPTYNYIITSQIKEFKDGNTTKNIIKYYYDLMANNQTTSMFDGYEKNGHTLLTEIPNLNLGLYLRDQPALSLQKDVYKADMEINGKQFTYRYDGKIKTPDEFNELEAATGIVGVKFDGKYTLPMYEADLNYTTDDHSKELKTTITYKIKLQNSSSVLDSYIHELTDISSEELNIARDSMNRPLIYIMNTSDPNNEDFNDENLIEIDESNSRNQLNKNYTIERNSIINTETKGLRSDIRFKNAIKLDNCKNSKGNSIKYLYIVFTIDKNKIKTIYLNNNSTNDLFNVVEIRSYSSKKNNKEYAHVDYNSIPNNVNPMQLINRQNNGEDDDDVAPGLRVIKPTQRQITGIVFEDMPVQKNKLYNKEEKTYDQAPFNQKVDPGEERVGDGIYDTSAGNNMDTNGDGIPDVDKPISDVKVKLVDSEGNPAKFWSSSEHEWKTDFVLSKADGTFDMTGFIPGDYHVEFVWGEDAGGKDVSRYKCTILSNPFIRNRNTALYEQEIEYYNTWYGDVVSMTGKSNRYSDAKDDYIRRLAIDKLKLNVDDEAYNGLTTPDGTPLLNKVNKLISDVDGKTDDSTLKYMHSSTAELPIEVEKDSEYGIDGYLYSTDDQTEQLEQDDCTGLDFNIKNIDFGIIERPKRAMSVQKRIKSIKVTTPEGRPIIIATIGIDGKVNAIAGEKFISGGYNLGYLYAQIDKNIEQAMKVETEYDIIVSGLSELDYDDVAYYLYGIVPADGTPLQLRATNLYDYSGGATITSDSAEENNWQTAKTDDNYLKIPNSSDNSNATVTEQLLIDIFNYKPDGINKVGKQNNPSVVEEALEKMNIFSNYEALDNSLSSSDARKSLAKIYAEFIDEWNGSAKYKNRDEISVELIRTLKLENREIVQCNPENILVKEPYDSTEVRIGTIKTSKIIANGDDIKIENDVEIASVAVDTNQKTGANADPTYAPLYDRAEYVTVTPAQGEDKDYIGKAIVGIGILTVLASGIILVKRFINK